MERRPVKSVLEENTSLLMAIPGVVGIGQGEYDGKPCIKVFVKEKSPELLSQIPENLGGYSVIIEETGEFHALG